MTTRYVLEGMPRYMIELKQRSGKWMPRCEADVLEVMLAEWERRIAEMDSRAPGARRKLRLTKVENEVRTVLASHNPPGLLPRAEMTALVIQ